MSNTIGVGDLVMVVRGMPCCGKSTYFGVPFVAVVLIEKASYCTFCKTRHAAQRHVKKPDGSWASVNRLIKIDPPSEGDNLPTRADLDIPVKAVA